MHFCHNIDQSPHGAGQEQEQAQEGGWDEKEEEEEAEQEKEAIPAAASGVKEVATSTKVEIVKAPIVLLKLEPPSVSDPSVRSGDWHHRVGLILDTVTETSSAWWVSVSKQAQTITSGLWLTQGHAWICM